MEFYVMASNGRGATHLPGWPFVTMSDAQADLVGRETGLDGWSAGGVTSWHGRCSLETFLECLGRWPDGHPDPQVQRLLAELLVLTDKGRRLARSVGRRDLVVVWE
ncbi:hypothetical protein [Actinomadura miaoliensis]|uniref:hypothetical protein n=1 Tax=Actinomadura miaoliensis TaxID=430685 RepID=UPI0031F1B020